MAEKFNINDNVIYGNNGVCVVSDICEKTFNDEERRYYILKPVYRTGSILYVPVDNEMLIAKIKRVLTKKEIMDIIDAIPNDATIWIDDNNERKIVYRDIISSGDRHKIICLIKTLYARRNELAQIGRKLHQSDEHYFREAEKILYDEFALVLELPQDKVLPFIVSKIENSQACV